MKKISFIIFMLSPSLCSPLLAITLSGKFINPEKQCVIEFKQNRLRFNLLGISNTWFRYEKKGNSLWIIKGGSGGGDLELNIVDETIVVEPSLETFMIDGVYYKEGSRALLKKLEKIKKDEDNEEKEIEQSNDTTDETTPDINTSDDSPSDGLEE